MGAAGGKALYICFDERRGFFSGGPGNTGYSSVGRASDCRRLQQSYGPWFDSGWPDICACTWRLVRARVCCGRAPKQPRGTCARCCRKRALRTAWLSQQSCAGATPFGLTIQRSLDRKHASLNALLFRRLLSCDMCEKSGLRARAQHRWCRVCAGPVLYLLKCRAHTARVATP